MKDQIDVRNSRFFYTVLHCIASMHVYFYVIPTFKQYLFLAKCVCVFYRSTSPVSGVFPLAMATNKHKYKHTGLDERK